VHDELHSISGPEEPGLSEEIPTELNGAIQAVLRRVRRARQVAAQEIGNVPMDGDSIKSDARRAHTDGDTEGGRRRVFDHHRNLATDAFGGLNMRAAAIAKALEDDIRQLREAEAAEQRSLKRTDQFDHLPGTGTPWTALSIISIVILAAITFFLFYSSMKVVQGFLEQLGRVDNGADGFVLAPLTVLAPFAVYIISLTLPTREARKRYTMGVAVTALICMAMWVLTFPLADPSGGGGSNDPWGAGGLATPRVASAWYVSTVAQLLFDVLLAATCKITIHLVCDTHAGERHKTKPQWRFHTKRIAALVRARKVVEDALAGVKAKQAQMDSRTAAACKRAAAAYDDRLKKLRTDALDAAEIPSPTAWRSTASLTDKHGIEGTHTNLNGRL
jgi:hypothetical protein